MHRIEKVPDGGWDSPWDRADVACKQLCLAMRDLADWFEGARHPAFDALCELLRRINESVPSVLEVGCGAGYYQAVVRTMCPECSYYGLDKSASMVRIARAVFGQVFAQGDAESLTRYCAGRPHTIILGSVIGHVEDWRRAIEEAFIATDRYVILHRVACYNDQSEPERLYCKDAYGHACHERQFDEQTLLHILGAYGELIGDPVRWSVSPTGFQLSCLARSSDR